MPVSLMSEAIQLVETVCPWCSKQNHRKTKTIHEVEQDGVWTILTCMECGYRRFYKPPLTLEEARRLDLNNWR